MMARFAFCGKALRLRLGQHGVGGDDAVSDGVQRGLQVFTAFAETGRFRPDPPAQRASP
jgi:hypothetical protein